SPSSPAGEVSAYVGINGGHSREWPRQTWSPAVTERASKRRFDVKKRHHIKGQTTASAMPMIHVCSLSRLADTGETTRSRHAVTLLKHTDGVERPGSVAPANHLILGMDDITVPMDGYIIPCDEHVTALITFVRGWDRVKPLVLHCYAGISRSTAGAYVAAC